VERKTIVRIVVIVAVIAALLVGVRMLNGSKVATPPIA
jgi:hypothetical protein